MTGLPEDLTARLATMGLDAPTLIQRQRDVATWRCAGKAGNGGAILKIAESGRGRRIILHERQWLERLSFMPPVRLPRVLAARPGWLVMEQLAVPHIPAPQAAEVLARDAVQARLASLLVQLTTQQHRVPLSWVERVRSGLASRWNEKRWWRAVVWPQLSAGERSEAQALADTSPMSLVFSHGDLNERNILIDPSQDWIGLIDFQEAGYRMPGYDLISLCHHARQPLTDWRWQRPLLRRCWADLLIRHRVDPTRHLHRVLFHVSRHQLRIDLRLAGLDARRARRLLAGENVPLDEPRRRYAEGAIIRFANLRTVLDAERFPAWAKWALEERVDHG